MCLQGESLVLQDMYNIELFLSPDPDEMLLNAAFHQYLHCLLVNINTIFFRNSNA